MNTRWMLLLPIAAISILTACRFDWPSAEGSGVVVTHTVSITGFSKVQVHDGFTVTITKGDANSVAVTADDNIMNYIGITKEADTLVIFLQNGLSYSSLSSLQAELVVPALSLVDINDSSKVTVSGFSSDARLEANVSESGHAEISNTASGDIVLKASNNGEIVLDQVSARDMGIELSGNSVLRGSVTSSGSVSMNLSTYGEVNIEGSGGVLDIETTGNSLADLAGFTVTNVFALARHGSRVKVSMDGVLNCTLKDDATLDYTGVVELGEQVDVSSDSRLREF